MKDQSWPDQRHINIIIDPPGWFTPFGQDLANRCQAVGLTAQVWNSQKDVMPGCIAFYLSCLGIAPPKRLALNKWNIVVHASDLPQGRGFSPLTWQILDGKNTIPLSMITMAEAADAGDIVMQRQLEFQGHELNDEMRSRMGQAIVDMCFDMANSPTPPRAQPQHGTPTWYGRRCAEDSRLDPNQSIADQFNLLRVVDNQAYPAFFDYQGHRYTLTITRNAYEGSKT
jgi:methionyl-tRNA formyltransferase